MVMSLNLSRKLLSWLIKGLVMVLAKTVFYRRMIHHRWWSNHRLRNRIQGLELIIEEQYFPKSLLKTVKISLILWKKDKILLVESLEVILHWENHPHHYLLLQKAKSHKKLSISKDTTILKQMLSLSEAIKILMLIIWSSERMSSDEGLWY